MLDTIDEDLSAFYVVESDMNLHKISLANPNGIWLLQLPWSYKQCGIFHRLAKTLKRTYCWFHGNTCNIIFCNFL
jgi:hypothetical protein